MPSRPIKILPQFLCRSLFCAPRCAKGCEHKINIIPYILSQQQQDFNSPYLLFAIISKDYTVVKELTFVHFLRSVLFYRTLARSFLANFMESITFKAIPHNWTKTPQLSLCGVALDEAGKRTLKDPFFLRARKRVCHRILHSATDPLLILLLYLPFIF